MKRALRHLPGLGALCVAAAGIVTLMTAQTRGRLADLSAEVAELRVTEADLLDRLLAFQSADGAAQLPPEVAWPQDEIIDLELAVQDALLNAAGQAGLFVVSFGSLGASPVCPVACLTYDIELEGGHEEVVSFLSILEGISPPLSVASLWLRQRPPDGQTLIAPVTLRLSALALAPAVNAPRL